MRYYALLAILTVVVPLCAINPYFGVLVSTVISYLNPHQYAWQGRFVPVALLTAIPTLIGLAITRRRWFPPVTKETVLMVLLWIWFAVTTAAVFFSEQALPHVNDTTERMWMVSKILLMTFVAMALVNTRERLRIWYLVTAAVFGLFFIKAAIFGLVTAGQFRVYGPENSFIADNNDFGLASNMCLPLFTFLLARDHSKAVRIFGWVAFVCGILAVILTYSRGALVGLACVLVAMAIKSRHRIAALIVLAVLAIAILSFVPQQWLDRMTTIETAAQSDESTLARFRSWHLAMRIAADHPFVGGGFETFTDDLFNYYDLPGAKAWGAHSIYFQALGEHGFIGLMLFLGLLGSSFWSARRLARRYRQVPGGAMYANVGEAMQISLVGFASSGAFLGRAYFDLYFQIVAMVIVAQALGRIHILRLLAESEGRESGPELDLQRTAGQPLPA